MSIFKKKKATSKESSTPVDEIINITSNEFEIGTKEEDYKADGTIVIGSQNADKSYTVSSSTLPPKIDVEARKRAKVEETNSKKKKAVVNEDKQAKRVQSIVALIVLILFGGVYGVFYYYRNIANVKDFTIKTVHVEYGEPVSLKIADYVNAESPDEKLYTLDLTDFVPDLIGEYTYKITYAGITKAGKIEVSDTQAPEVEVQEISLNPGDTYTPEMFMYSCTDLNSCYATFEDGTTVKTANEEGKINVYIVIKDSYGNQVTKQALLNTRSTNVIYTCSNTANTDYNAGYRLTTAYEITFNKEDTFLKAERFRTYEYVDHNNYLLFKEGHLSNSYTYDDTISTVVYTEEYTQGFNGNTSSTTIRNYLATNNYTCSIKR